MIRFALLALLLLFPNLAHAHETEGLGFLSGFSHPVVGFDHLLAMLSVGMLSAQIGRSAIWSIPALFMLFMLIGAIMGIKEVALISVELGIALSVMVLGAAIALEKKLPIAVCFLFVSIFGLFHGNAHGGEMPEAASPFAFALGFMLGTAAIHLAGIGIAMLFQRTEARHVALRIAGIAIALSGSAFVALSAV